MISRRSFFGALAALALAPTLARIVEPFKLPKSKLFGDDDNLVGEWQAATLKRQCFKPTGSVLMGLMSRLENEEADSQKFQWFEKGRA